MCHCEAVERAEAIPVAMKAMFLTAEDADKAREVINSLPVESTLNPGIWHYG